tara:strand:- start:1102 stop:1371 length:270 start_codon:yes stop_codon:yes gene_type:complete
MRLVKATDGVHKWIAEFDDGKRTSFGAAGMDDYTIKGDDEQRLRYLMRHRKNENWNDPKSAGALSRYILWGDSTSIEKNLSAYKRRFNL